MRKAALVVLAGVPPTDETGLRALKDALVLEAPEQSLERNWLEVMEH